MGVVLGKGDGTFTPETLYSGVIQPDDIQTGDFRNNRILDLAVVNNIPINGNSVSFFGGNGDGTFAPAQFLSLGGFSEPFYAAVGDFNGDGKLDLAVTADANPSFSEPGIVGVFLGNGDGTFASPLFFSAGNAPRQVEAGDFTGTGRLDLVLANRDGIVLLHNGPAPQTPNQLYVERLYIDLLNRSADPAGLAYFSGLLDGGTPRSQVVLAMEQSLEYRTDQVEQAYQAILGRQADPAGLQYFVGTMLAGRSLENVEASIYGSGEFYARAGGTVNGFLSQLYYSALGRAIDPAGQADFTAFLARGFSTFDVAFFVVHSIEARQRLVNGFYNEFLGRDADPAGLASFTAPRPGGTSDDLILAAILGSAEYFADLQSAVG
jgi:hypothetical protein